MLVASKERLSGLFQLKMEAGVGRLEVPGLATAHQQVLCGARCQAGALET